MFFFKDGYRPQEAMLKNILEFSRPFSDICQLPHFVQRTQHTIFRIEYYTFSKAKFGNFQKLLKLNIYYQIIVVGEKTQFELNLMSFN